MSSGKTDSRAFEEPELVTSHERRFGSWGGVIVYATITFIQQMGQKGAASRELLTAFTVYRYF